MSKRNKKAQRQQKRDAALPVRRTSVKPDSLSCPPADRRVWLPLCIAVLVLSCGLLFFRLGHYPLWGDEADTALFGRGIARTGDASALIDHNIYAYRDGTLLKNLYSRYTPPGSYYFVAPFVGVNGTSSLWPRIPFAICGLLSVAFILYWMYRSQLTTTSWIVTSVALLCNMSFFLYCRQARYYSLAILLSIIIVYLYVNWNGRRNGILWMMLASAALLVTHYLAYAGLYVALACDYLLFARRQRRPNLGQWLMLLGPQLLIGIVTVWIYNPIGSEAVPNPPGRSLLFDKLTLIWWNFRDLNNCEFCVGIVMLAAPLVYFWTRNLWLLRGAAAVVSYTLIVAILSPQPPAMTYVADVRYNMALIPLCVGLSAIVIVLLARYRWFFALPLAVAVFGSNVLNYPFSPNLWSCRPAEFVGELWSPRATSIDVAARWINDNVREGESIWVLPDYMEGPLMYHAPNALYAWQLSYPPKEQFAALPLIHFIGQVPPDYFIIFGPLKMEVERIMDYLKGRGIEYQSYKTLDIFWDPATRPEIFWRSFQPIENFNRQLQAVYVYRRASPLQGR